MSTITVPDLWPEFGTSPEPSPLAILRQQGFKLGERTRNIVYGEVETKSEGYGKFAHTLYLTAPFFQLRQQAVVARHGIERYPVEVAPVDAHGQSSHPKSCANADDFVETLRTVLAAPHLVQLINSLIAQARDLDDEE